MIHDSPYRVRRVEFWGHPNHKWTVVEGDKRRSKFFDKPEPARKLKEKMDADWLRYRCAMMDTQSAVADRRVHEKT